MGHGKVLWSAWECAYMLWELCRCVLGCARGSGSQQEGFPGVRRCPPQKPPKHHLHQHTNRSPLHTTSPFAHPARSCAKKPPLNRSVLTDSQAYDPSDPPHKVPSSQIKPSAPQSPSKHGPAQMPCVFRLPQQSRPTRSQNTWKRCSSDRRFMSVGRRSDPTVIPVWP